MSQGQRFTVSNREQRAGRSHRLEPACGTALKPQLRGPSRAYDLDVTPEHPLGMARAQRLHGRFLSGKTGGKMRCRISPAFGVRDFSRREDTIQKPVAVSVDRQFNAIEFGRVESYADDMHACSRVVTVRNGLTTAYSYDLAKA